MRLVGSLGRDAWGALFRASLGEAGVDLERMRVAEGPTGRCVCLVGPDGQRTMRPCLSDSIRLQAAALEEVEPAVRAAAAAAAALLGRFPVVEALDAPPST